MHCAGQQQSYLLQSLPYKNRLTCLVLWPTPAHKPSDKLPPLLLPLLLLAPNEDNGSSDPSSCSCCRCELCRRLLVPAVVLSATSPVCSHLSTMSLTTRFGYSWLRPSGWLLCGSARVRAASTAAPCLTHGTHVYTLMLQPLPDLTRCPLSKVCAAPGALLGKQGSCHMPKTGCCGCALTTYLCRAG